VKYTKTVLQKLETLLEETGYVVRYEKGNFNSGYCIVEQKKIAIVNKFFDTEGRINSLSDILSTLDFTEISLTEASAKFYDRWKKRSVEEDENPVSEG
jgi:hypothetical protein